MSDVFLCPDCGQIQPLDGSSGNKFGATICYKCANKDIERDLNAEIDLVKPQIVRYCADIIIKNKYNTRESDAFLAGIQAGIGISRASDNGSLDIFLSTKGESCDKTSIKKPSKQNETKRS